MEDRMMYEGDNREVTLEEIERALVEKYGSSDYDREAGCYCNGVWMSVNEILRTIEFGC